MHGGVTRDQGGGGGVRRRSGTDEAPVDEVLYSYHVYLEFFTPPSNGVFSGAEEQMSLVGGHVAPMWPRGGRQNRLPPGTKKQAHARFAQACPRARGRARCGTGSPGAMAWRARVQMVSGGDGDGLLLLAGSAGRSAPRFPAGRWTARCLPVSRALLLMLLLLCEP
ncbi:uncharacterized protein LY79DRAFT_297228 [Colletotrichum navitas]|uniref:Uncharacterized protein n=1 Tax=Colletotrichum navitas TaxID=681940 RepID=A0AAD8PUZ4_9PEZI|nr:uncharacterized protein LY79DRAFT_297228 [Colletotrichum navitas]KAK1580755.1 hypothetical protein LY79DRAFT_297228 [Colletotrichum navitas]